MNAETIPRPQNRSSACNRSARGSGSRSGPPLEPGSEEIGLAIASLWSLLRAMVSQHGKSSLNLLSFRNFDATFFAPRDASSSHLPRRHEQRSRESSDAMLSQTRRFFFGARERKESRDRRGFQTRPAAQSRRASRSRFGSRAFVRRP